MSDEAVGAVLNGQWKLVRLIGEGGLAAVYEAHGLQGQGRRAVKLLHPHFRSQRNIVERFYVEAKACYSLRHPHIASVEAYSYAEDGSPFIVMELLEGVSLSEFLRGKTPMEPAQAVPLLHAILQALSVAHGRGIVHRDLKPPNIFLVQDEEKRFSAKVLDFGIAKVMDAAGGMGSKTRTGAVLGTPGYMSPEQIKDAKKVDARTDLWSAGIVFYEMLTCRHPFDSADKLSRMMAVLREPPRPISELSAALAAFNGFFEQALRKDPAERYQSADQMIEGLRAVAAQLGAPMGAEGTSSVTIPQAPNPAPLAQLPPGPGEGTQVSGPTQISGDEAKGNPVYMSAPPPSIQIITAPDPEPLKVVWWMVLVIGLCCLTIGFGVGYMLGGG